VNQTHYQYIGNELELFAAATNWKKYVTKLVRPYISGSVLEAGAGIGTNTLYFINDSTTHWLLLEPDDQFSYTLTELVKEKKMPAACEVFKGYTADLATTKQFDCIIYIDVMEHIEQDRSEMESATRLLKTDGFLIVLSPAHQFLMSPFDRAIGHYRRYTKKSLSAIANEQLKLTKMIYTDSIGFFASLANKLLLQQKYPTKKQIHFWDTWMVPLSVVIDKLLFFKAGKTVIGVWKKNED